MNTHRRTLWKFPLCPLLIATIAGCAASATERMVQPGDQVGVQFTCRMKNGDIAASTLSEVNNSSQPKSKLFLKRVSGEPLLIEAGSQGSAKRKSFEDEIIARLSGAVLGMRQGGETNRELTAERYQNLAEGEEFIKVARVRKQAKVMKMTRARFRALTRKNPVVGMAYSIEPGLPGEVTGISGDEVEVHFAQKGSEVELPFGRGVISDRGDHFEIEIETAPGFLIRTGGLVGRVVEVDKDSIKLDYGHPFAGESLACAIKVESVQAGEPKALTGDGRGGEETLAKKSSPGGEVAPADYAVREGDLVTVNYTAAEENGAIFGTTLEAVAKDPARKKVPWIRVPKGYAAVEIVAGKDELLPGIGAAVLGLTSGARKQLRLPAEKAFGAPDPSKIVQLPCARTFPRTIRITAEEFTKRFASSPTLNQQVDLIPYFRSRVTGVTGGEVALEFQAKDGASFKESYGTVSVQVAGDQITTTLVPSIGAEFPMQETTGVISATDGTLFTVDANNPLAGQGIVVDLEVVKIAKAQTHQ